MALVQCAPGRLGAAVWTKNRGDLLRSGQSLTVTLNTFNQRQVDLGALVVLDANAASPDDDPAPSGGSGTPSAAVDATSNAKGVVKLAGDLGGSADAPQIPGLAAKMDVSAANVAIATMQAEIDAAASAANAATSSLASKASTSSVAAKADQSAVDTAVSSLNTAIGGKADAASVTSGLAAKADQSALSAALALKADQSALTSGLAGKAATGHTHVVADVSGLPGKLPTYVGQGTKTWAIGTLLLGGKLSTDLTVTGAQVGDFVLCSLPTKSGLAVTLGGEVSAVDTVTVTVSAIVALTVASATLRVTVLRFT